jgi:hypothetical protein
MNRARKWLAKVGCVLAALVLLIVGAWIWLYRLFHKPNIPFDSSTMNAVVDQVKKLGPQPGKTLALRLESLDEPKSLRARRDAENDRGMETGNVWASRAETGELTVIVLTLDEGHAGRHGYAYSEKPPRREPSGIYEIDEYEYLNCTDPTKQVADRWWEVWSCWMD